MSNESVIPLENPEVTPSVITPVVKLGKTLCDKALIINVKIGSPLASKKDQKESNNVAADNGITNKSSISVTKALLRHEFMKDLTNAAQKIRLAFYRYSAPWNDNGGRICRVSNFIKVKQELEKLIREYYEMVDKAVDGYEAMIEEDKVSLQSLFNPKDYPSKEIFRRKLYAKIEVLPVEKSDYRNGALGDDEVSTINSNIENRITEAVKNAEKDSLGRVLEKLNHLKERLTTNGKFHDSTVDNVIKEIDETKDLNIAENPAIDTVLDSIRGAIASQSPDSIRNSKNSRELATQVTSAAITEIENTMAGLY